MQALNNVFVTRQVRMAASVNDSLASLDALHSAAGGLDAKLQQSLEHQVLPSSGLDGFGGLAVCCSCHSM